MELLLSKTGPGRQSKNTGESNEIVQYNDYKFQFPTDYWLAEISIDNYASK